eukprot:3941407-Rhodomonas_salina.8
MRLTAAVSSADHHPVQPDRKPTKRAAQRVTRGMRGQGFGQPPEIEPPAPRKHPRTHRNAATDRRAGSGQSTTSRADGQVLISRPFQLVLLAFRAALRLSCTSLRRPPPFSDFNLAFAGLVRCRAADRAREIESAMAGRLAEEQELRARGEAHVRSLAQSMLEQAEQARVQLRDLILSVSQLRDLTLSANQLRDLTPLSVNCETSPSLSSTHPLCQSTPRPHPLCQLPLQLAIKANPASSMAFALSSPMQSASSPARRSENRRRGWEEDRATGGGGRGAAPVGAHCGHGSHPLDARCMLYEMPGTEAGCTVSRRERGSRACYGAMAGMPPPIALHMFYAVYVTSLVRGHAMPGVLAQSGLRLRFAMFLTCAVSLPQARVLQLQVCTDMHLHTPCATPCAEIACGAARPVLQRARTVWSLRSGSPPLFPFLPRSIFCSPSSISASFLSPAPRSLSPCPLSHSTSGASSRPVALTSSHPRLSSRCVPLQPHAAALPACGLPLPSVRLHCSFWH